MTEFALPLSRFTAETHLTALNNLIERYDAMDEPVYYKEAALGDMDETTCSSCLRFFSDIGLLNKEDRGVYTPRETLVEYSETDFSPESEAFSKIREELEDENEVFQEAVFFLGRESIDNDELAVRIVEQEEDLDEDETDQVQRFLEISERLNLLRVPESASQETEKTSEESISEESVGDSESKSQMETAAVSVPDADIELSDLPSRGDPDSLIDLCGVLKDGGTWSKDELSDDGRIDYNNNKLNGNLNLGRRLGFIEENDEGEYLLSDKGYELVFEGDTTEASRRLFRDGVRSFPEYLSILDKLESERAGTGSSGDVENTEIIQLLRTKFSLREPTEDPLKRATTVFFKTLEAAGFGEYKAAGGGYPTRFGVGENYNLTEILDELTPDVEAEAEQAQQTAESQEAQDASRSQKSEVARDETGTSSSGGPGKDDSDTDSTTESSSTSDSVSASSSNESREIVAEVNVELDVAEMDTAELEAKLDLLAEYGVFD